MRFSGLPPAGTVVPEQIARLSGGRPLTPIWLNELGGLTYQVGTGPARRFAKWAPAGSGLDLTAEAERLEWAVVHTPVPRVLDHGSDSEGAWLLTAGLPGDNAVSRRWKQDPETAVRAVGAGLRTLHEALPVDECPFTWSVESRLAQAGAAPAAVPAAPPVDKLVVCHGDPCVPNTLIDAAGQWSGHVELASLGTADRWADLAVSLWSAQLNYGAGWESTLLDAYGIDPDPERTSYYRKLWDVC